MPKKKKVVKTIIQSLDPVFHLWGWILLAWCLYRYFFKLPEYIDEFVAKPLVFVVPVLWYVINKEKRRLESLGLTYKNLFPSLYAGLGLGLLFALEGIAANALKYGKLTIVPIDAIRQYGLVTLMILSTATAFSEELLNRGFLFNRILEHKKSFLYAAFISTLLFVLLHVPILATSLKLQGMNLVLFFITDVILGFATSALFYAYRSLVAPILIHIFWNMTVALYL